MLSKNKNGDLVLSIGRLDGSRSECELAESEVKKVL